MSDFLITFFISEQGNRHDAYKGTLATCTPRRPILYKLLTLWSHKLSVAHSSMGFELFFYLLKKIMNVRIAGLSFFLRAQVPVSLVPWARTDTRHEKKR